MMTCMRKGGVPGKRTILQTTLNVFLSVLGNLKQYQVYINRTCDSLIASFHRSFSYTLTATKVFSACKEMHPLGIHGIFLY